MNNVKEFKSFEEFRSAVKPGDEIICTGSDSKYFTEGEKYRVLCVEAHAVVIEDKEKDPNYPYNLCCWENLRFSLLQKQTESSTKQKRVALAKKYREALDMYNQAASIYQEAQDKLYEAQSELEKYGLSVEEQEDNSVVIKYNPPTEMY